MAKGKSDTTKSSSSKDYKQKNPSKGNQSGTKKANNAITKNRSQKSSRRSNDDNKIHYVLNPKKLKEKSIEVKEKERQDKQKSIQTQKRKRNSAFLRTTSKGQPVLAARMKVLYGQIEKTYGSGK